MLGGIRGGCNCPQAQQIPRGACTRLLRTPRPLVPSTPYGSRPNRRGDDWHDRGRGGASNIHVTARRDQPVPDRGGNAGRDGTRKNWFKITVSDRGGGGKVSPPAWARPGRELPVGCGAAQVPLPALTLASGRLSLADPVREEVRPVVAADRYPECVHRPFQPRGGECQLGAHRQRGLGAGCLDCLPASGGERGLGRGQSRVGPGGACALYLVVAGAQSSAFRSRDD